MNLTKANAILAIAAAALAVPTWLTIQGDLENFVDTAQVPKLFEGFTADNVAAVALGKPKDPQPEVAQQPGADPDQKPPIQYDQIQFQRTDKGFVLGQMMGEKFGAPVNPQMLELQVWKHLSSIPADRETLVQENASEQQLADYGLDPLHAFVIKAFNAQQQVIAELLVGKDTNVGAQGTDTVRGVYVRRADSRDVAFYEVPMWNRAIDPQQWLDLSVAKIPADMVRRIEVKNQTGQAAFVRKKGESLWTSEAAPAGKGAARQIEVESLVQRLGYVQAQDYVRPLAGAQLAQYGLDAPKVTVSVVYEKDGKDVTFEVAAGNPMEGKPMQFVRCSASDFVCALPVQWAAGFERDVGEFFDPAAQQEQAPKESAQPEGAQPAGGEAKREEQAAQKLMVPTPEQPVQVTPIPQAPGDGGAKPAVGGTGGSGEQAQTPTPEAKPEPTPEPKPAPQQNPTGGGGY
jgi:hypothetical protein